MPRSIRPLDAGLLPEVAAIEKDSFAFPWSEEAYRHELTNPLAHYLVLCEGDRVLGYGGFWLVEDEAHVTNVAVKREERGHGCGREVMDALIALAREKGVRAMTLEVRVSNFAARKLYDGCGFVSCGVRPHYYPDGEDAVILWKVLE